MKVYGPYTRKDGRKHVILIDNKKRRTVSYPRYLMEQKLGRTLTDDETVDHIDGDFTNDDPSNLRVISRKINALIGAKRLKSQTFACPMCGTKFTKSGRALSDAITNAKRGKAGPFCSRRCQGRYGTDIQNGYRLPQFSSLTDYEYVKLQGKRIPLSEDRN